MPLKYEIYDACAKKIKIAPMSDDIHFMRRAIEVAEEGRVSTAPNPWVGCVLVKDGKVISEGYHVIKGGPHAEIVALNNLDNYEAAKGATAFVTLEPCCHYGATPPCVEALIKSRVSRVVVAISSDPDENVNGGGIVALRNAGIDVLTGVCEDEARLSLRPYLHQRSTGRPFVVVKVGMSLNGKVAYEDGTSKWITSEASRNQAMSIRESSQAILVGVATVISDNPRLTLRGPKNANRGILNFTRVIIDPNAKLASAEYKDFNVLSDGEGPTVIFTTRDVAFTGSHQVEWVNIGPTISLKGILNELGKRGVIQLLVEGGATTIRQFFDERLANRLTVFIAPHIIGSKGLSFFTGNEPSSIHSLNKRKLALESVTKVDGGDGDIRVDYSME